MPKKSKNITLDIKEIDACWEGYEAIGLKKKGKKMVPNCVPKKIIKGGSLNPLEIIGVTIGSLAALGLSVEVIKRLHEKWRRHNMIHDMNEEQIQQVMEEGKAGDDIFNGPPINIDGINIQGTGIGLKKKGKKIIKGGSLNPLEIIGVTIGSLAALGLSVEVIKRLYDSWNFRQTEIEEGAQELLDEQQHYNQAIAIAAEEAPQQALLENRTLKRRRAKTDAENVMAIKRGTGIIKDIKKGVKKATKSALKDVRDVVSKGEDLAQESIDKTKKYVKAVVYGRNDYPPKVRKILKDYGNEVISELTIKRTPVSGLLTGALSLFSLGKFGKRMNRSFDELFHLFLEIKTQSGKRLSLEKNEVIDMNLNPAERPKTEIKKVTNLPQNLTIQQMLDKTKEAMGTDNFFRYSAIDKNCQDFLLNIFKANNIGDESDLKFIKQDTKQLFKDLPYLAKLTNAVTDLGAKVNVITEGAGVSNYVVQSVVFSKDKWTTPKAKKWLKENQYIIPKVDKTDTQLRFRQMEPDKVESDGFTEYRTKELGDSGISLILAYKKNKISIKSMKGKGAIPTQVLVEEGLTGGSICKMCSCKMEEMEGGKLNVGKAIKKAVRKAVKPAEKLAVSGSDKVVDYVTSKKGGLASDLVTYGIPAVTSGLAGLAATAATGGNPVAGMAASAVGAKAGAMAAKEVSKAAGTGVTRKGRFAKGSPEAKAWGEKMRAMRGKK